MHLFLETAVHPLTDRMVDLYWRTRALVVRTSCGSTMTLPTRQLP